MYKKLNVQEAHWQWAINRAMTRINNKCLGNSEWAMTEFFSAMAGYALREPGYTQMKKMS